MTHKEKAEQLLKQQYHCSQALFGAFADDFQMNLKTAFKISTCFGGGMRQGGVCGCVSSSLMILGLAMGFMTLRTETVRFTAIRRQRNLSAVSLKE